MALLYKSFEAFRTVLRVIFIMFLSMGALATFSQAQAATMLFIVEDVKVDVTAENAMTARNQAFEKAQIKAFETLAGRMLSEEELQEFPMPEVPVISTLIKDFEVTEERLSSVRYVGTYTFRFKEREVQQYFGDQGVRFSGVGSKPLLILPFYQHYQQTVLWSPYNAWLGAWNDAEEESGILPIRVPLGDLSDVRDLGGKDALTYEEKGLRNMLERYDTGEAALILAIPNEELSAAQSGAEPVSGSLSIHLYRTDRQSPEYVQSINMRARGGISRDEFYEDAVEKVKRTLQRDWKSRTSTSTSENNRLQVRVRFASLEEWAATQRVLNRVPGVNETVIKTLSPAQAVVDLLFQGSEQRLRLALQQSDMVLSTPKINTNSFRQGWGQRQQALPLVYDLYMKGAVPEDNSSEM